jgi:hypothetical protein
MPRIPPKASLHDRRVLEAMSRKDEANELPPGPLRDARIRRARQAVTTSHLMSGFRLPACQAPQ